MSDANTSGAHGVDAAQEAAGLVQLVERRLAGRHPFHAAILAKWVKMPAPDIETMAVSLEQHQLCLRFSPKFVLSVTPGELLGVMQHEVNHVIFGHLEIDRSNFTDPYALLVAMETTANEHIAEPLPGEPLRIEDYDLPPNETTLQRYRRLCGRVSPPPQDRATRCGACPPSGRVGRTEVDGEASARLRAVTRAICAEVQAEGIVPPQALAAALAASAADAVEIGVAPGAAVEVLPCERRNLVDWRRALRRFVGSALERAPSFSRPPRRFPDMIGIVPGHAHQSIGLGAVQATIDTSGSVDSDTLARIAAELRAIARLTRVVVVQCDTEIRDVAPFRGNLQFKAHGRGGTDLRPPLERKVLRRTRAEVVLYFTDGLGPAPERPPGVPLVWVLVQGGRRPAPYGVVVEIDPGGEESAPGGTDFVPLGADSVPAAQGREVAIQRKRSSPSSNATSGGGRSLAQPRDEAVSAWALSQVDA